MKSQLSSVFSMLLLLSILCLPTTFAQDSPQFSLPEGAKARFGKGTINQIQYSPNGTRFAVASSIGIWIYDTATYKEIALLTGHTENVNCIAFSPDGSTLASGSTDNTIRLWDVATGKHIWTFKGHTDDVNSITFNTDGSMIVSGSSDGTILLWNIVTSDGAK